MKAVIQRVKNASVAVGNEIVGSIDAGILVLLGITHSDGDVEIDWLINKVVNLRIFDDENGVMNRSVLDIAGGILVVSNFTLYGNAQRGFRPSYTDAAPSADSEPIYNKFIEKIKEQYGTKIRIFTGVFGAEMDVSLVNDGPVTIIVEK
ncbi:MAG: D-tyrosyl-tRNA(Tyr) deacylase [Ignavibacteria bacterium]|jgi:D-tyrosyl-tRNA(Tyr) deacylase|nr:D-tyrosyl-tRNA(Tyr) deacylase [Ignavibacteria bacterium]